MKSSDVLLDGIMDAEIFESSSIRKSIHYYLRYWKLFLFSFVIFVALAGAYIYYAIPQYKVSSTIMLKDESKGAKFLENPILNELSNFKSYQLTDNEIDVLHSSGLMKQAVSGLNFNYLVYHKNQLGKLTTVPNETLPFSIEVIDMDAAYKLNREFEVLGVEGDQVIYSVNGQEKRVAFDQVFQNEFSVLKISKTPYTKSFDQYPLVLNLFNSEQLASMMSGNLKVEPKDKNSSVLYISLKTEFPVLGVNVVNELITKYNENAVAEKKEVALNSLNFLDSQLAEISDELTGMQSNIQTFKSKRDVVDIDNDSKLYQQSAMDNLKELSNYQSQLEILRNLRSEILVSKKNITVGPLSSDDPALLTMIQDFNSEVNKLDRMAGAVLPGNPVYEKTSERIATIKGNVISHLDNRISALQISSNNLAESSNKYNSKYHSGPIIQKEYEALTRDLDFKKNHYISLIKMREETSLYLASVSNTHSKTIEKAGFSPVPISPNKPLILLISVFAGFVLPFGFLFFRRSFQEKLEDRSQLALKNSDSVLGELSQLDKKTRDRIINQDSKTPFAEQLRFVRTSYCMNNLGRDSQVVLVTSTVSGEGKTFFAMNFAKSMSMIGKKTAVLFYDLRKPLEYADMFENKCLGIADYITNKEMTFSQLLDSGLKYKDVTLFHTGSLPSNPAEVLLHPRNQKLIAEMRKHFEFIVLDSAPVGQVPDTFSLVPLVDSIIYMMRYNWTSKSDIQFFQQIRAEEKINNPMIVLNGSKVGQGYSYGYYQYS